MSIITKHITRGDIDLANKLDNMLGSEISQDIYEKCSEQTVFDKVEEKIWKLMRNSASVFSRTTTYEGLTDEYETDDEHEKWSACVYNCDLLYMTAIAYVLKLETPKSSGDIHIFGM